MSSGLEAAKVLTPEERLRRYKELLGKLATEESIRRLEIQGQISDGDSKSNPVGKGSAKGSKPDLPLQRSAAGSDRTEIRGNPIGAHRTESSKPAEHSAQLASLTKSPTGSSPDGKNRILLKVKQRSIDSEIDDVRRQREDLERRYEKGRISREEYEHEFEELIKRGQTLLLRKTEVCKELEAVGQK